MNKKQINQGEAQVVKEVKRLLTPYFKENAINRIDVDFKIRGIIAEAERRGFDEGFKQGFNDCKQMVEKGEHSHCCIISGKELINQTEDK